MNFWGGSQFERWKRWNQLKVLLIFLHTSRQRLQIGHDRNITEPFPSPFILFGAICGHVNHIPKGMKQFSPFIGHRIVLNVQPIA